MHIRIAIVLVAAVAACGHKAEPRPLAGSAPPPPTTGSAPVEGCNDAHECKLRDVCGCSCTAVLLSAPPAVACEESCPNKNVCDNHSVICDLSTHRCGAIPKSP